jgi:hypothetical protein
MVSDDYRKGYRDGFSDAFDFLNKDKLPEINEPIKTLDTDIECMECGVIWSVDNNPITFCKNITCPFK